MGILHGTKHTVNKVFDGVNNRIAKRADLSSHQVEELQRQRAQYLREMPDPADERAMQNTERMLAAVGVEIFHAYLPQIRELYLPVEPDAEYGAAFDAAHNIRYINITKWVTDTKENSLEKLVNVYAVLSNEPCNIALVFHRTKMGTQVYLAVVNTQNEDNNVNADHYKDRLIGAIRGNFPGAEWGSEGMGILPCLREDKPYSIATASNIPTEKSEKFISQTIEKLLDGIVPDSKKTEYTLILLATPIPDVEERKLQLGKFYSGLSPYASWQKDYHFTDNKAFGSSATAGVGVNLGGGPGIPNRAHLNAANAGRAARSAGTGFGMNFGANFGANFARSSTVTVTVGKSEGISQTFTNFNIKHALDLLETQVERLEQSTALGMWDFAAYVLSEDQTIANHVAHAYLALTLGETSYMSKSAMNLWRGNVAGERDVARVICSYIRELRHPIFGLNPEVTRKDASFQVYPAIVTATTSLSGKELAYSLNFPQKSISGLPILACAEFGRNVVTYGLAEESGQKIALGKVFHMNHVEQTPIDLSLESLKSHAFLTGSTGSGKSNTVYHILGKAREAGVQFLVIEPAKGEYKHVFGKDKDVSVYGTNPDVMPLLRINPFSFPQKVHILEHLDRLVEIFNVCWPMYAAMPAVLKSAVEQSYRDCGWDLTLSKNRYGARLYPDFADVARNIKDIIERSEYDRENQGAYKGALLTRLQSLTSGINGLIFSSDAVPEKDLFERNVIVDLSRVGSSETKSLIMGMLILKLQEFRMTGGLPMNANMRHLTVLEEAHHLLRRTSIEQPTEGANILGKSVEMIANAIAEMRTYGEGFLIVDQAPGLMDLSVIRNTNTKMVMRLPDQGDRELVGKSANLSEEQITELAKLPCGVAAVYQNEWVQPVLCKVEKYEADFGEYVFRREENDALIQQNEAVSESLLQCIMDKELFQIGDKEDLRELKSMVLRSRLPAYVKVDFLDYLGSEKEKGLETLRVLMYDFLKAEDAIQSSAQQEELHAWVDAVLEKLEPSVKNYSKKQIDLTVMLLLQEQMIRDISYQPVLNSFLEAYRNGGGVF